MKHIKIRLFAVCACLFLLLSLVADPLPQGFVSLMDRAKMTFDKPDSLMEAEIKSNHQMNYEYALAYPGKHFEVRYSIRPLDSILARYYRDTAQKKPGNFMVNPNELHNALFRATVLNVFGGNLPPLKVFNPEAVKSEFNADWGAVVSGQVTGIFGDGYRSCVVVAIHKDNAGDAYYFYLADSTVNSQEFSRLMGPLFHTLKFK